MRAGGGSLRFGFERLRPASQRWRTLREDEKFHIRIIPRDRVKLAVSPFDLSCGRIAVSGPGLSCTLESVAVANCQTQDCGLNALHDHIEAMALTDSKEDREHLTVARYARVAGVAMLLSIVFGVLGEMVLPGTIVVGRDPAATAANILGHPTLFRLSFAAYLVEAICDVALCVFFYILLRPVDRRLALLSAFFGIASMITYAVAQSSFFASSLVLGDAPGMSAFNSDQRNALAYLAIRISSTIAWLFLCLYGIASMIRGHLIARSTYIPKVLGVLFIIGGACFFLRSATYLLAPKYSSPVLLIPMACAGISMMAWLLLRGIDPARIPASRP